VARLVEGEEKRRSEEEEDDPARQSHRLELPSTAPNGDRGRDGDGDRHVVDDLQRDLPEWRGAVEPARVDVGPVEREQDAREVYERLRAEGRVLEEERLESGEPRIGEGARPAERHGDRLRPDVGQRTRGREVGDGGQANRSRAGREGDEARRPPRARRKEEDGRGERCEAREPRVLLAEQGEPAE